MLYKRTTTGKVIEVFAKIKTPDNNEYLLIEGSGATCVRELKRYGWEITEFDPAYEHLLSEENLQLHYQWSTSNATFYTPFTYSSNQEAKTLLSQE